MANTTLMRADLTPQQIYDKICLIINRRPLMFDCDLEGCVELDTVYLLAEEHDLILSECDLRDNPFGGLSTNLGFVHFAFLQVK